MTDTDAIEDIVFDDDERIEIASSYPDAAAAIKALDELDANTADPSLISGNHI